MTKTIAPSASRMTAGALDQPKAATGIKVTDADIGRNVIYRTAPMYKAESGVITSFNDKYIFVRYGNSIRGVATNPADLEWTFPL